jgi:hypothetical protein
MSGRHQTDAPRGVAVVEAKEPPYGVELDDADIEDLRAFLGTLSFPGERAAGGSVRSE